MDFDKFIRSIFLFNILHDQGYYLKRYEHADYQAEYGLSCADFCTCNENEACEDAADWWHGAGEHQHQQIVSIALSRITNEMDDLLELQRIVQAYLT